MALAQRETPGKWAAARHCCQRMTVLVENARVEASKGARISDAGAYILGRCLAFTRAENVPTNWTPANGSREEGRNVCMKASTAFLATLTATSAASKAYSDFLELRRSRSDENFLRGLNSPELPMRRSGAMMSDLEGAEYWPHQGVDGSGFSQGPWHNMAK